MASPIRARAMMGTGQCTNLGCALAACLLALENVPNRQLVGNPISECTVRACVCVTDLAPALVCIWPEHIGNH